MKKRKKLGVIGKREAKEKGVWKLDKSQAKYVSSFCSSYFKQVPKLRCRYQLFVPLHHLWMSYMSELLALAPPPTDNSLPTEKSIPSSQAMYPKLVKADFHGAIISGTCFSLFFVRIL